MRILFYTVVALMLAHFSNAQVRELQDMSRQGGFDNTFDPTINDAENQDSVSNLLHTDSIESAIYTWKMERKYSHEIETDYDTVYIGYRTYDPIFKECISNTYLGNLGSPYLHNNYFKRKTDNDFYFFNSVDAYVRKPADILFFNTTTPFTFMQYSQSDNKNTALEERFSVFHTRNVNPNMNIGFEYNSAQSMGQYVAQETKHNYTNAFATYKGDRYKGYIMYITGRYNNEESGGITGAEFLGSSSPSGIPVEYSEGVLNNERYNKNFEMAHEYVLGKRKVLDNDTIEVEEVFEPWVSAQFITSWSNFQRMYIETKSDSTFFPNVYKTTGENQDSTYFRVLRNTFQLHAFEAADKRFSFGKRAYITNEVMKASYNLTDSTYFSDAFTNIILGGEIYKRESDFWKWSAAGKFYLIGRNAGDLNINGRLEKPFVLLNDTTNLEVTGFIRNSKADFFQEHYFGNHYQWENDFRQTQELSVSGAIDFPSLNLKGGAHYSLLRNYVYNNEEALPAQYEGEFSVVGAWVENYFKFWRFFWQNKVVWQETSNSDVLHLPQLSVYSALGYSHKLFKVLDMHIGAEVYYNTAYYADAYEPSTSRFYLQSEEMIGNYPYVNLFGDLKLKRSRFFVKLVHVNTYLGYNHFYSLPNYPMNQMSFRFGLSWTFYN